MPHGSMLCVNLRRGRVGAPPPNVAEHALDGLDAFVEALQFGRGLLLARNPTNSRQWAPIPEELHDLVAASDATVLLTVASTTG